MGYDSQDLEDLMSEVATELNLFYLFVILEEMWIKIRSLRPFGRTLIIFKWKYVTQICVNSSIFYLKF